MIISFHKSLEENPLLPFWGRRGIAWVTVGVTKGAASPFDPIGSFYGFRTEFGLECPDRLLYHLAIGFGVLYGILWDVYWCE